MSGDDAKDQKLRAPAPTDSLALGNPPPNGAETPDLTDTLSLTETLKIVDAPVVEGVPEIAVAPFRRAGKGRLREQVVRSPVSEAPKQFIVATKPPKLGVTLRQVTQLTFVVALIGYLLLAYLKMRTVTEVQKAVSKTAAKSTDTL